MNILLFILISYGLTNILIFGHLFNKIRPDKRFFKCPMCIGFWSGLLVYLLFWTSGVVLFPGLVGVLMFGWLSSGTSYVLINIFDDEGLKIINLNKTRSNNDD